MNLIKENDDHAYMYVAGEEYPCATIVEGSNVAAAVELHVSCSPGVRVRGCSGDGDAILGGGDDRRSSFMFTEK